MSANVKNDVKTGTNAFTVRDIIRLVHHNTQKFLYNVEKIIDTEAFVPKNHKLISVYIGYKDKKYYIKKNLFVSLKKNKSYFHKYNSFLNSDEKSLTIIKNYIINLDNSFFENYKNLHMSSEISYDLYVSLPIDVVLEYLNKYCSKSSPETNVFDITNEKWSKRAIFFLNYMHMSYQSEYITRNC